MFRAGTTFLSNLLDPDGRNCLLLRWEAGDSPAPTNFRSGDRDPPRRHQVGIDKQSPGEPGRRLAQSREDAGETLNGRAAAWKEVASGSRSDLPIP
jgi:hypothetical protein